jgi:hypothetical protein
MYAAGAGRPFTIRMTNLNRIAVGRRLTMKYPALLPAYLMLTASVQKLRAATVAVTWAMFSWVSGLLKKIQGIV